MTGSRADLARAQAALLAALLEGGPAPQGMDPERLRVQAAVLAVRRGQAAARSGRAATGRRPLLARLTRAGRTRAGRITASVDRLARGERRYP